MDARKKKEVPKRRPGRPRKYEEGGVHPLVFRIPNDLYDRVKRLADEADVALHDVLMVAIRSWLKGEPRPTPTRVKEWVEEMLSRL